ncbi:hypothetical protein U9M48_035347 [Paspalum notatum var. saurae]|uniref:Uncharacterized protein n=1 Tax=Paspalum notatum var. saurae TaxID=547442 RepID=A0AAQ3UEZ5_PASNO
MGERREAEDEQLHDEADDEQHNSTRKRTSMERAARGGPGAGDAPRRPVLLCSDVHAASGRRHLHPSHYDAHAMPGSRRKRMGPQIRSPTRPTSTPPPPEPMVHGAASRRTLAARNGRRRTENGLESEEHTRRANREEAARERRPYPRLAGQQPPLPPSAARHTAACGHSAGGLTSTVATAPEDGAGASRPSSGSHDPPHWCSRAHVGTRRPATPRTGAVAAGAGGGAPRGAAPGRSVAPLLPRGAARRASTAARRPIGRPRAGSGRSAPQRPEAPAHCMFKMLTMPVLILMTLSSLGMTQTYMALKDGNQTGVGTITETGIHKP